MDDARFFSVLFRRIRQSWKDGGSVDFTASGNMYLPSGSLCNQLSRHFHVCLFQSKAVLLDGAADLRIGHLVPRLEVNSGIPFVQAHIHGLDSVHFHECHAHGVGADRSIHAEDREFHGAELGLCRCGEQKEHEQKAQ